MKRNSSLRNCNKIFNEMEEKSKYNSDEENSTSSVYGDSSDDDEDKDYKPESESEEEFLCATGNPQDSFNGHKENDEVKPLESTVLHTKFAIYKNILSYNIDSFEKKNSKVVFHKFNPIKQETPAGIFMQHDEPMYDIFLSSDDDDELKEWSNSAIREIPIDQFVCGRKILNPD
ncbi:unnamed protein product [Clavelina lepadiformis]|uniref:Uncharacterized protein n=1 Tax=Clavelina lepadiformis TaxID=159417 RepID=A0ABP0F8Y3_CLALP